MGSGQKSLTIRGRRSERCSDLMISRSYRNSSSADIPGLYPQCALDYTLQPNERSVSGQRSSGDISPIDAGWKKQGGIQRRSMVPGRMRVEKG